MASRKSNRATTADTELDESTLESSSGDGEQEGFLKNMSRGQKYLLYGVLGAAAVYGIVKIPIVRKMALPVIATAATKNWGMLKDKLAMA
jgi:hypothetical protein